MTRRDFVSLQYRSGSRRRKVRSPFAYKIINTLNNRFMEIKQIEDFGFTRLTNAYHIAFFSTFLAIINKHVVAQLKIPAALVDQFAELIDAEQSVVNRNRASASTIDMDTRDKERDNYFRIVMYKLRAAALDTNNTQIPADVANVIQTNFVNTYPLSIISDAYQVETAKIKGLINDIDTTLEQYKTVLGIESDVTRRKTANLLFEQAYLMRVNERALADDTKQLRQDTERGYVLVSNHLVMNANTTSTDPDDIAAAEKCALAIDETNQLISEYKWKTSTTPTLPNGGGSLTEIPEVSPEMPEETEDHGLEGE